MSSVIRDFWLSHPEYWISIGKVQAVADKIIYDTFYKYDYTGEDTFGKIIYFDQFMRHFSRMTTDVSEIDIIQSRECAIHIIRQNRHHLLDVDDLELIWYLMPFKHMHEWSFMFQLITDWTTKNGRTIVEFPTLNRFFMDSYKKAFTSGPITPSLVDDDDSFGDDYDLDICESHPQAYDGTDWNILAIKDEHSELLENLKIKEPITISLSGGVDSMLMATLLKRSGVDVIAAHIVYGNRRESSEEFKFIKTFCQRLDIPLYFYIIKWLRRDSVDRAFYEKTTRDIRFNVYKSLGRPVLLGHIQEDVIENIWTNIAHGTHLDNLAKFERIAEESGVTVIRPWLSVKKTLIYSAAETLAVPYLKNTTPSWSNRGKFREHFYAATHAQYGEFVDEKLLEVAARIKMQATLLDKLLFQDISASWCPDKRRINVSKAVGLGLDAGCWLQILTDLAHNKLGLSKPSYSSCEELERRIAKGLRNGDIIHLKKGFTVSICICDMDTFLSVQ
jgi:tRNA(Ile)-lysidine synthetase-like protein